MYIKFPYINLGIIYTNVMSKSFTSVKVDKDVYEQFKRLCINKKLHLQDLVNRSLYLFTTDSNFRESIYNYVVPAITPNYNNESPTKNVPTLSAESQAVILPSLMTQVEPNIS